MIDDRARVEELMIRMKSLGILVLVILLLGACADHSEHTAGGGGSGEDPASQGEVPGAPAPASAADREIVVSASDALEFDPSSIQVSAGEVVNFVVKNEGQIDHEFVLGDEAYQAEHEEDMQGNHHMSAMENAVTVAPGQTKELSWEFSQSGSLQFGCHEPGHYEGGMFGTIEIR